MSITGEELHSTMSICFQLCVSDQRRCMPGIQGEVLPIKQQVTENNFQCCHFIWLCEDFGNHPWYLIARPYFGYNQYFVFFPFHLMYLGFFFSKTFGVKSCIDHKQILISPRLITNAIRNSSWYYHFCSFGVY